MKQLYVTLEDKEKELRDFIRNYEQRMRESETSIQRLAVEVKIITLDIIWAVLVDFTYVLYYFI